MCIYISLDLECWWRKNGVGQLLIQLRQWSHFLQCGAHLIQTAPQTIHGWVNSHINRNYASWHISRCKISRCILPSVASARPPRKTKQIEQIHKSKEIYNIINSLMTYLVNILKMFSRAWLRKPMFSCIWKAWEIDRDCISSYFHNTTKCTIE